jgi:hypothetical protein
LVEDDVKDIAEEGLKAWMQTWGAEWDISGEENGEWEFIIGVDVTEYLHTEQFFSQVLMAKDHYVGVFPNADVMLCCIFEGEIENA